MIFLGGSKFRGSLGIFTNGYIREYLFSSPGKIEGQTLVKIVFLVELSCFLAFNCFDWQ
jgi:predicted transcriptional regulator